MLPCFIDDFSSNFFLELHLVTSDLSIRFLPVPRCTQPRRVAAMSVGGLSGAGAEDSGSEITKFQHGPIFQQRGEIHKENGATFKGKCHT